MFSLNINADGVTTNVRNVAKSSPNTIAIVFGLLFATFLTLVVTPSALMFRENIKNWYKNKISS